MPPWNSLKAVSIQRNDYKSYNCGILVNHLADADHWQTSAVTHALHAVNSNLFWWNCTNLLYFPMYLLILVYKLITHGLNCGHILLVPSRFILLPIGSSLLNCGLVYLKLIANGHHEYHKEYYWQNFSSFAHKGLLPSSLWHSLC